MKVVPNIANDREDPSAEIIANVSKLGLAKGTLAPLVCKLNGEIVLALLIFSCTPNYSIAEYIGYMKLKKRVADLNVHSSPQVTGFSISSRNV